MELIIIFQRTPLILAIENKYIDVIKLLLSYPKLDINRKSVFLWLFLKLIFIYFMIFID